MIIYQVYPRSFSDANRDGLGDLNGLYNRLLYLADLGVQMIWISPFFKSPMKDFGYDVSDYCAVDPMFGTLEEFEKIISEAKTYGIGIMIDMVLSHTSDQHPWFLESRSDRKNEKADWYVWADAKADGSAPNNWISLFGGSAWQWDSRRRQYYLHNFLREQPDLNFHQPKAQQALLDACEFWLKKGVRGFRLDVCNFYFHSAGLEDNPAKNRGAEKTEGVHDGNPYNFQKHIYDKDQPQNLIFLNKLRNLVDKYESTILMGEVVSDDSIGVMKNYIGPKNPLHTAYNFSLFQDGFDTQKMADNLKEFESRIPNGSPSWALGNHDVPRYTSRFKANGGWPQSSKCFLFFLFLLRGNVILYQGDELGLDEVEVPFELLQDPFGIEFYPEFKGRDGCRTPMPWNKVPESEKSWLPVSKNHLARSVSEQAIDSNSVLNFAKALIAWRKNHPWLETAPLSVTEAQKNYLILERKSPNEKLVGVLNVSSTDVKLSIPEIGDVQLPAFGFFGWIISGNKITAQFPAPKA